MVDINCKIIANNNMLSNVKSFCLFATGFLILLLLHLVFGGIWLAMFAFRYGVIAISKFVPGLGRPWTYKDVLFLEDYNHQHRENIAVLLMLQGDISCTTIRQLFTQKVLQAKIGTGSSQLKFPELTQRRRVYLGFLFWADDPCFKTENHISEVLLYDQQNPHSECFNSLENMMEEFTQRPYLQDSSPWEIWILRNFPGGAKGSNQTVLLWRCHHSLADGHSIVNILINSLGQKKACTTAPAPQSKVLNSLANPAPSNSIFSSLVDQAVGFCSLQLDLIQNKTLKQKLWTNRQKKGGGVVDKNKVHFKFSPQLARIQVKAVAASLGVRVPVLLTTLAAHNFVKVLHSDLATTSFYASYVLPLANHPDTLANHMSLGGLHLPISNSLDFSSSLKFINTSFSRLSSNPANRVISYLEWFVGNCPVWIVSLLKTYTNFAYTPIAFSNFVWDSEGFQVGGLEVKRMLGGMAPTRNVADSVIVIQGYATHIDMSFAVNDSLLCEEDVERIVTGIGEDFENLLHRAEA